MIYPQIPLVIQSCGSVICVTSSRCNVPQIHHDDSRICICTSANVQCWILLFLVCCLSPVTAKTIDEVDDIDVTQPQYIILMEFSVVLKFY